MVYGFNVKNIDFLAVFTVFYIN